MLSWSWSKSGIARPCTIEQSPGVQELTSGTDPTHITIPRVEVTSTYRTLGAHISPSRLTKGTVVYLRDQSVAFASKVSSSTFTQVEAYWAFWQYYTPQVGFSVPTLSLSQANCHCIQAPAITATLSKLHLNQHTARPIIFGPARLGELKLLELYSSAGIGQLCLFVGNLCPRDKTSSLILIDISYIQLLVGSTTLFFNLPLPYSTTADGGWLISIWQFITPLKLQLCIPDAEVPAIPHLHDMAIMDYFTTLQLRPAVFQTLNCCRVYSQVIFISDVSSPDGTHILSKYLAGNRAPDRNSGYNWPQQPRPHNIAWIQWRSHLQCLQSNGRLIHPLGKWITSTHQRWSTFVNPVDNTLYLDSNDQWSSCAPITDHSLRITHSSCHPSYDVTTSHPVEEPPLPTALLTSSTNLHRVATSPNTIPASQPRWGGGGGGGAGGGRATNSFYPGTTLTSCPLWTALGRPSVRMIYMSALMAPITKLLLKDPMHGSSQHLQELSYGMEQVLLVATAL